MMMTTEVHQHGLYSLRQSSSESLVGFRERALLVRLAKAQHSFQ